MNTIKRAEKDLESTITKVGSQGYELEKLTSKGLYCVNRLYLDSAVGPAKEIELYHGNYESCMSYIFEQMHPRTLTKNAVMEVS